MVKLIVGALLALSCSLAAAVDVNRADQAALEGVKGIGPGLSAKLMKERSSGAFKDWTDLIDRVPGVGAGNAARFSAAGLTVNGKAYEASVKAQAPSR